MRDDGEDAEAAATAGAGEDIATESVTHPACQAVIGRNTARSRLLTIVDASHCKHEGVGA
jgi:hypothetical protein